MTYWMHPTDPDPNDLPLTLDEDETLPTSEDNEEQVDLPAGIEEEDPSLEKDLQEEAALTDEEEALADDGEEEDELEDEE